jgi:hypothetical protein
VVGVGVVVVVVVDLEQPTRITPAINIIANNAKNIFFNADTPFHSRICLPVFYQVFVFVRSTLPPFF